MTTEKNYDELLYPILCSEGNIIEFFDRIFDFLYRRTDYFKIKTRDSSAMGLEHGEAENIVRNVFCKYMQQAVSQHKIELKPLSEPVILDYIAEEVVSTTECDTVDSMSTPIETANDGNNECRKENEFEPKTPWMDPDCYNGAKYDEYSWAQTFKDVDIRIKVPKYIITGKQVHVNVQQGSITTKILIGENWNILKTENLTWKINVEESTWTLIPGEHIHICLQKMQDRWWDSLFQDEPKIDMKSIDPSMSYEDLDEESQAKINELMYNEHQKRMGKPTIQQNKIQSILKEAWNSEGSPFKGQPFDPSVVDVQNADSLL